MSRKQTKSKYFDYLAGWMDCRIRPPGYEKILELLFETEFYSLIPYDDNRIVDGLNLRVMYEDATGETYDLEKPCSVLEMMIALADRMSYILYDPDVGDLTQHRNMFWTLVSNLGLRPENGIRSNQGKIQSFLERSYTRKGIGGLFPLKKSRKDQRKVEIWYQMQEWVAEQVSHL